MQAPPPHPAPPREKTAEGRRQVESGPHTDAGQGGLSLHGAGMQTLRALEKVSGPPTSPGVTAKQGSVPPWWSAHQPPGVHISRDGIRTSNCFLGPRAASARNLPLQTSTSSSQLQS